MSESFGRTLASSAEKERHQNYFRDYDPATGRYVEPDPIGLKGGIDPCVYANSNPVNMVDPFGLILLWPLLNLPTRDSCKPQEWKFCEGKCAPGIAKGCYVTVRWRLKGIRGGEPIRSEQRTVNCNCEDACNKSSNIFVPILSPAPVFFPVTSPVMIPVFP